MLWYNILNPRNWPGVNINTGNNKIDGVYYNLLSSNHVSLAASGSIFLAANSGIRLISPSFVDTSGIRANRILAENFGKINNTGGIIPLYDGPNSGIVVKLNDSSLSATNIITYNSGTNTLHFPSAGDGSLLYTIPQFIQEGVVIPSTKRISSFDGIALTPESTDEQGEITQVASVSFNTKVTVNSGISLGPNNNLESYKGYILTHDGSGNVAQWKPATYLRENYNTALQLEGLERVGASWIRYPKRPALLKNNKLYIYTSSRIWSPYDPIVTKEQLAKELGTGSDTICIERANGEVSIGYVKMAFVAKAPSQLDINEEYDFDQNVRSEVPQTDPDGPSTNNTPVNCFEIEIAPENPGGMDSSTDPINVFVFSVTKGAYFPMQIEPSATGNVSYKNGLGETVTTEIKFKPSTLNNISIRPNVHTAFNMLGENIDFIIYGKKNTIYNNYDPVFNLNSNFIPQGLVPTLKVDANIINSVSGSPTGVIYSTYLDRNKTIPTGWGFEDKGKVCINTSGSYVLSSIVSGEGILSTYADLTVSGHTYSTSLVTEDIYLKPTPIVTNTNNKYIPNALLTVDYNGKIISRTPRLNPVLPSEPLDVRGSIGHSNAGAGHYEYSIQWTAPQNDGRSKIIRYHIQFSLDGGASWTNAQDSSSVSAAYIDRGLTNQLSCTIKTLSSNTIFRVAAQNSVGIGPYSEASENFVANISVPTSPLAVSGTREIITSDLGLINLSWSDSAQLGPGGSGSFSGYIIEESEDYGKTWYYYNVPSGNNFITNTYETIAGLSNDQDYLYRLSAWNNNGPSAYSFIYFSGSKVDLIDPEEEEAKNDVLGNWDFGVVLFTGVCSV